MSKLSDEEVLAIQLLMLEEVQFKYLTNLFFFSKYVLGYNELSEGIHKPLCDIVSAVNPIIIKQAGKRCPLYSNRFAKSYMHSLGLPHISDETTIKTVSRETKSRNTINANDLQFQTCETRQERASGVGGVGCFGGIKQQKLLQNFQNSLNNNDIDYDNSPNGNGIDLKSLVHYGSIDLGRIGEFVEFGDGLERLFLVARGHFKTTLLSIAHTIQLLLLWPEIRILIVSHKQQGGSEPILGSIRTHFKANKELRALFPDYAPKPNSVGKIDFGTQDRVILPNRLDSCAWPEGNIEVAGSTTDVTGRHFDYIKNDDLVTRDSVTNESQLQKTREFKNLQVYLFNQPEWGITDNIGTIYHFNDMHNIMKGQNITKVVMPVWDKNEKILFYERFSPEGIQKIKDNMEGGIFEFSCNPYEAPVWMADGTFKPIGEIRKGDKVIGWKKIGSKKKLCVSTVLEIGSKKAQVQTMHMSNGDKIRCTPDHKWYTKRVPSEKEPHRKEYRPAKVGSKLFKAINPCLGTDKENDYAWLAGFIDGEGGCKHGSHIFLVQSIDNMQVIVKLRHVLSSLDIEWSEYIRKAEPGHSETIMFTLKGGRQHKIDIINYGKPAKQDQIMASLLFKGGDFCRETAIVESIDNISDETVYSMQTETGNYIIWGYTSKNCQYCLNPIPPESQTFRPEWLERLGFYYEPVEIEGKNLRISAYFDPASKRRKKSDFSAWCVIGVDEKGTKYLLDIGRDKLEPEARTNKVFEICTKWGLHRIHYETIGFQDTDKYIIDRKCRERKYHIEVVEIKASQSSKEDRIKGLQPLYERGDIRWPKRIDYLSEYEGKRIEMIQVFKDEMFMFPKCVHDDMLDCHSFMLRGNEYNATKKRVQNDEDLIETIRLATVAKKPNTINRIGSGGVFHRQHYKLPARKCLI